MYNSKLLLLPYFALVIIAFSINFWTGIRGVFPIDTFLHYDTAFKILENEVPIRDYWVIHGISLDYFQSLFFYIFGVNWISYLAHSSIFNSLTTIFVYIFFNQLEIGKINSFLLSVFFSILAYPVSGVPFLDHHATFFCLISLILFYFSIKHKRTYLYYIIPILFGLAFLSKPVPSFYIFFSFLIVLAIYILKEKDVLLLRNLAIGSIIFLLLLFIFFKAQNVPIRSFYEQIILYPLSIGEQRITNIFEMINNRIFNYKFIILSLFLITFLLLKNLNYKKLPKENNYIIFILILFSIVMIFHQLLTKNQNFIFFLIPLNVGLILYLIENTEYKKNVILFTLIITTFLITLKYHERFNIDRKFHELQNVNLNSSISSSQISKSLYPLKWITPSFKDPEKELLIIKKFLKQIDNETGNILLITNYNFIDSITEKKLFMVSRNYDDVTIPSKDNKFFLSFKNQFTKKINENNIEKILIFSPKKNMSLKFKNNLLSYLEEKCFDEQNLDFGIDKIIFKKC